MYPMLVVKDLFIFDHSLFLGSLGTLTVVFAPSLRTACLSKYNGNLVGQTKQKNQLPVFGKEI